MPKPSEQAHTTKYWDMGEDAYYALLPMETFIEDLANAKPGGSIDWAIVRANEIVDEWRGVGKIKAESAGGRSGN